VRAGKLKALGVSTSKRFPALPDVPTIAESGIADYEVLQWWGIVAPKGTPKKILADVRGQIAKILQMPEVQERLAAMGAEPGGGSPEQFDALIRSEIVKWGKVIEAAAVTAD
jgi:tripartite-type tricarboxylate transporter receptor subunit TctC